VADVATKLAPAQLLFVRRRGALGWLIRRVTASTFNHVALIGQDASGVWITVEAADLCGVQARRLESTLEDPSVTGLLIRDGELTLEERMRIMQAAWLHVGEKYDVAQLVGIYARRRLPWLFGGRRRALGENRFDHRDRLICSELVTLAWYAGARRCLAPPGVALGNVDPGTIAIAPGLHKVFAWAE
jgi:hypothetical protein